MFNVHILCIYRKVFGKEIRINNSLRSAFVLSVAVLYLCIGNGVLPIFYEVFRDSTGSINYFQRKELLFMYI